MIPESDRHQVEQVIFEAERTPMYRGDSPEAVHYEAQHFGAWTKRQLAEWLRLAIEGNAELRRELSKWKVDPWHLDLEEAP